MKKNRPTIIFEDDDLVILNKPANFLTIPDRFIAEKPSLVSFLKNKMEEVFIVHRLDKETSGVIIFAKNKAAHRSMSMQFEQRTVDKIYLALVEGNLHKEEGEIKNAIATNMRDSGKMIIAKRGKPSLTLYKVIERFKNYTLVEANIKTGRTHQVRVHFQSIGYPLAVDRLYGRKEAFFLSEIKLKKFRRGKDFEERPLMSRTSLHAKKITFTHPSSLQRMTFEVELPKDFKAVLNQLRKWNV
ncbi:MAG TPA: RluA family pseudouridine synthase [Phaeodactylibacter sp.]|nr:RluA family pseudouridine synthase [Phaeodactylibacter sp.]